VGLMPRAGLVGPVSIYSDWVGGIMFICSMVLQCAGTIKPGFMQSGPVTADLTTSHTAINDL